MKLLHAALLLTGALTTLRCATKYSDAAYADLDAGGDADVEASTPAPDTGVPGDAGTPVDADASGDASPDAHADAGPCDRANPFGAPVRLATLQVTDAGFDFGLHLAPAVGLAVFGGFAGGADVLFRATQTGPLAFTDVAPISELNASGPGTWPTISADGLVIFFESIRAGGAGESDIWTANRLSTNVGFGVPQSATVNTGSNELEPFLASDGALYFSSDRGGAAAGLTLYVAPSTGTGFVTPFVVPGLGGTHPADSAPTPSADGLTIYWARGSEIWVATRVITIDPFSGAHAVPELAAIGTEQRQPSFLTADGCGLYFNSDGTPYYAEKLE